MSTARYLRETEKILHTAQRVVAMMEDLAAKLREKANIEATQTLVHDDLTRAVLLNVATTRGLTVKAMVIGRHPASVAARDEVYRQLRALGYSLPAIGKAVGRHHTSVLHRLKAAQSPDLGDQ